MFRHIALLLCDMQVKVLPHIKRSDRILNNVNTLIQANHEYRKTTDHSFKLPRSVAAQLNRKTIDNDPTIIYGYFGAINHYTDTKADYNRMDCTGFLNDSRKGTYAPIGVAELLPKKLGPTTPIILNNLPKAYTYTWEKPNYSMFDKVMSQNFRKLDVDTILLTGVQTEWCITQTALDYKKDGYNVVVVSDGVGSTDETEHTEALDRLKQNNIIVTTCHGWIVDRLRISEHPLTRWYVNKLKHATPVHRGTKMSFTNGEPRSGSQE